MPTHTGGHRSRQAAQRPAYIAQTGGEPLHGLTIIPDGNVTSPKGFRAGSVAAGLRKKNRKDLGILVSDVPAVAAGVYTTNRVQAAPLKLTERTIKAGHRLQAIVCNSGNANACTGAQGENDALSMQSWLAKSLGISPSLVGVGSTGVIGQYLPMDLIDKGIQGAVARLAATPDAGEGFGQAILTTDTAKKSCCVSFTVNDKPVTLAGAAKGSGMIHPNMATMMGFLCTDANVAEGALQRLLRDATEKSFNRITVDGDTSTNDCVIAMANGLAGNDTLDEKHPDWPTFTSAFTHICQSLAKQIARDGEGATKLIEVHVQQAATETEAGQVAKAIIGSSLVKSAIFGTDANWGRILAAAGYSGAAIDPDTVDIFLGEIQVAQDGMGIPFDEAAAKAYLEQDMILIHVHLKQGEAAAVAWGCDLTYDYVKINARYRT
jgi:glutamate N-acetyltransferase/amino-acid N-acetyltransferase